MRIVDGGDLAWGAIAFGEQNPINLGYFQNQFSSLTAGLNDYAKNFYSEVGNIVDKFTNSDAVRSVRNALRSAASLFNNDIIKPLYEMEEFQTATVKMQRWIMANPVVRTSFIEQKCDGYSDSYVDLYPGKVKDEHYDYRRVMNGVVQFDEDERDYFKIYYEDLVEGDRELSVDEKIDILQSWEIVELYMKKGAQDPTSQFGANL